MGRQGKVTDSPTKTAIKKVKRVAEKARQDLAGAFATETINASYNTNLDTVDKSPTQIPRKSITIPTSWLAPQNSPAKAQGYFKDPPDEVVTHAHYP